MNVRFAKWDCSGPQAVLEAYGGAMSKLPNFLTDKSLTSYTYLKTKKNFDFDARTNLGIVYHLVLTQNEG